MEAYPEDAHQEENAHYFGFMAANHIDSMLAYWDKNEVCRFANNAYKKWFGKSSEEMIGKITMKELLGPLYDKNLPYIKGALNGNTQFFEREIMTPEGLRHSVANYYPDIENNIVKGFYVYVSNVTAFKEAENKLKTSELKFRQLLESAPDSIVIINEKGLIETVNAQTENLFGYLRDELINKSIELLMPERFRDKHEHHRDSFFKSPRVRPMGVGLELFAKKKNGIEFPVEISISPMHLFDKVYVSAAIRDISTRKEEEQKLRMYAILESKSKEMEQFAYIASHDLREPLLTIKNYVQLFIEDYGTTVEPEPKRYLNSILKATNRMDALIQALLDYSRLSKIKQLQEVNCNEVMEELKDDLSAIIAKTQTIIITEDLPVIKAFPLELKLLFQNLLVNAMKYHNHTTFPEIYISVKKFNKFFEFRVADNGIGIAEENKEKIFFMFQRLHKRDEFEGTGIGLAHCKKIVELHNGKIWVESKLGKGSTFIFTIPV
jgi:PAS domain S-box-containing protein